jgi:D-alanyl-D-alanine carboxypeptidase
MMAQTHKPPAGASIFLRAGALILLVATAIALVGKPALAREETWIVLDAASGAVLSERDADEINYPASLTKMMTLYLAFEALESRRIGFDTPFMVSEHAAMQAPSKLGLLPGDTISVRDLILGMVTKSANDAAVVMAEGLAGSEEAFASRMTAKAQALGMRNTVFRNASGLPNPNQYTTSRDLARLAIALYRNFPREYVFFSTESFSYNGRIFETHNHLMEAFEGMDGIKTGFINAAGFNLAASAVRKNHRLVGVIMGGRSAHSRDMDMAALLNDAFDGRSSAPAMEVAGLRPPPATLATFGQRAAQALMPTAHAAAATSEDIASASAREEPNPVRRAALRQAVEYRVKLADHHRSRTGIHVAKSSHDRHGRQQLARAAHHGHGVRLAASHRREHFAHNHHMLRHGVELAAAHSKHPSERDHHALRHGVELASAHQSHARSSRHDSASTAAHAKSHGRYAAPDHSSRHAALVKATVTSSSHGAKNASNNHKNNKLSRKASAKNHVRSDRQVKKAHGHEQLRTACHDSSTKSNHHACDSRHAGRQVAILDLGDGPISGTA